MSSSVRSALALTHVPFEDLGSLHPVLQERGFKIEVAEATSRPFPANAIESADLLIVLGGPIGVYETRDYPFLVDEMAAIENRIAACKPVLGICLGAQLLAAAMGARVYAGGHGSEIGWSNLTAPETGTVPEWFHPLLAPDLEVLHWHGDTFDLPVGARHLAGTNKYKNQAFMVDKHVLGLQFHVEVTENNMERWYVGHTCELRAKGIDVLGLREEGGRKAPALAEASRQFFNGWLNYIL